ncbi:hypothetical protein VE02_02228 [Pseudogymnoascus sp. 03VT05]|nr:hypothetical protein VE02_02228 [Pseudogymnoascus sp. 03VT05]
MDIDEDLKSEVSEEIEIDEDFRSEVDEEMSDDVLYTKEQLDAQLGQTKQDNNSDSDSDSGNNSDNDGDSDVLGSNGLRTHERRQTVRGQSPFRNDDSEDDDTKSDSEHDSNQDRITRGATRRSVANALNSTEASSDLGLYSPVLPKTHRSIPRLSHAFGFKSDASFCMWMDGDGFKPFYDDPQKNLQGIQRSTDTVQKALEAGESYGKQRYSRRSGPVTTDFSEIDFYALCLFNIVDFNTVNRNGAFFNKRVSNPEMQIRVWQAILHANHSNAPSRRPKPRRDENVSLMQGTPKKSAEGSAHGQNALHQDTQQPGEGSAHAQNALHQEALKQSSKGNSRLGRPKEANIKVSITANWDKLKKTNNQLNPFDLDTNYGRYITIHTALRGYEDPITIQTLYIQQEPAANQGYDFNGFNEESRNWFHEMERSYHNRELEYQNATSEGIAASSRLEDLLDNPAFQRLNYIEACKAIGITDVKAPQLPGMMPTTTLKSWQVTGINALIEFEKDDTISACVVADSTGLGKTIQTIGYWKVRLDQRRTLVEKPPSKPLLLIAPAEVLSQWIADMKQLSEDFIHVMY